MTPLRYNEAKCHTYNAGYSRLSLVFVIIPTRSLRPWIKQLCLDDLAHGILIACIIHIRWAIRFFVIIMLTVNVQILPQSIVTDKNSELSLLYPNFTEMAPSEFVVRHFLSVLAPFLLCTFHPLLF